MAVVERGTVVVIVEDDVEVRQSLADTLVMEGYEVMPVPSGEAALAEIARGIKPAVVILDLWLPGIGSGEFARRLQAQSSVRVPILVLTAGASPKGHSLQADAVLQKPCEGTAIVRAVDKLVAYRSVGGRKFPSVPAVSPENHRKGRAT